MERGGKPFLRWVRNTLSFYGLLLGRHRAGARALGGKGPVVILLCGWGGTRHTMSILEERLSRDGFSPYVFPLGGAMGRFNTSGIDELAKKLMRHISSLAMSRPSLRVAIIGHSMGGLIGRALVSLCGGSTYVHTLITLGTPHKGSPLAETARRTPLSRYSKALGQMVSGSRFLRKLSKNPIPPETRCVALFSESDHYCPPPAAEIEVPPGAENIVNIDAGRIGHVEFVVSEEIYGIIRRELLWGIKLAGIKMPVT